MNDAKRQTRSYLMALFKHHGFNPRTDLGQNFLIDLNLVDFIAQQAQLGPRDVVLEIGAGTGGLTTSLAKEAGAVISVEIDTNMHRLAQMVLTGCENVTLLNRDVLKNKNHFAPEIIELIEQKLGEAPDRRLKLVSNLPFSVATPVISNLVATDLPWERMVVTIQWELAQRLAADPGDDQYGAVSAWLQSQCWVKILKKLPPNVFWPRPQVHSAIMRLTPNARRRELIEDREFFHDFLRRGFGQRRKFFRSVLTGMYRQQLSKAAIDAILTEMNVAEGVRAERLDPRTLVALSNRLRAEISHGSGVIVAEVAHARQNSGEG